MHIAPLPVPVEPLPVHLAWHRDLAKHTAHEWLRRAIIDVCAGIVIGEGEGEGEKAAARSRRNNQ
jgi:hypothetical protein